MRRLFLFSSLLIAGLAAPLWGQAWGQTIANTAKSVNAQGDEGYWKAGQPDLMILWPQDDQNIVRRYRSQGGHPYRLWVSPDRGSGFPVVLKTRQAFDNFLLHIDRNPDKDWCEIVENPWSAWVDTGAPPTGCGALRHAQRRVCSTGAALRPCPNTCPAAEQTRVVTRTKSCPRSCSITAWSPNANTVCANRTLTQTRTAANCRVESRNARGTKSCPRSCPATAWSPNANTVCANRTLTQTRTAANCRTESRNARGTKSCPRRCLVTAWAPNANTVCANKSLTQTRTAANCRVERRNARGAKSCPRSCSATAWAPNANTVCANRTLTQTRTAANCRVESRTARGTKSCPRSCPVTAWAPNANTVCYNKSLTQTRTAANCRTEQRSVRGTKSCPRRCPVTAWSPNANTVCANKSLTQTRTAANCRGERRSVKGTKSCAKERKCRGGLLSVPTCSEVGSISVRSFSCSAGELARQHSQGCARSMSGNFRSCGWTRGSGSYYISSGRVYVTLYRAGRATLTCVRR